MDLDLVGFIWVWWWVIGIFYWKRKGIQGEKKTNLDEKTMYQTYST